MKNQQQVQPKHKENIKGRNKEEKNQLNNETTKQKQKKEERKQKSSGGGTRHDTGGHAPFFRPREHDPSTVSIKLESLNYLKVLSKDNNIFHSYIFYILLKKINCKNFSIPLSYILNSKHHYCIY